MNDVALRWLTAGDPCAVPDLGALWIASEPVRLGTMPTATVGAVVVAGADAASTPAGARFAGAGFRADPSADASPDALVKAARDALARARRAPEEIDTIVLTDGHQAVHDAVFAARPPALVVRSAQPLHDAIVAIETGRARRVLVLERPYAAIAQAAVVETTRDGSPAFMHGAITPAPQARESVDEFEQAADAVRAFGLEVPLPPALTVGLVAAHADLAVATEWIRSLGLRGTAVVIAGGPGLDAPLDRARRLIASGSGTAFLVTDAASFALVTSVGFRRATTPP